MEPLTGLDSAFLALETETTRAHVAGVVVLGPFAGDNSSREACTAIRSVVAQRLHRVPRLAQRTRRAPLGLWRPAWVDDPDLDLDHHVRPAVLPAPGGRRELEVLVGEIMSRPLDPDRPLWEMVVAEGLAHGRTAVVARLHHAILDGEAGATALGALLDLTPDGDERVPVPDGPSAPDGRDVEDAGPWRHGSAALVRQLADGTEAVRRVVETAHVLAAHNRELASEGKTPPPAPFHAPRTSLNGGVTGARQFACFRAPLEDLELARDACGEVGDGVGRPTVNDVILCIVGGALAQYFDLRHETPSSSLVALVPVSTRRRGRPRSGAPVTVGNDVSGMLVPLATTVADPGDRLCSIARSTAVAKSQEDRAGGDLLETVLRPVPPVLLTALMRGAGSLRLFDHLPPPFNVVVSNVVVPDVPLWWAGRPVVDVYPVGPVAEGFGLNVTTMTYRDGVHFGLLAAPRLLPDVEQLAVFLDDALAALVLRAMGGR